MPTYTWGMYLRLLHPICPSVSLTTPGGGVPHFKWATHYLGSCPLKWATAPLMGGTMAPKQRHPLRIYLKAMPRPKAAKTRTRPSQAPSIASGNLDLLSDLPHHCWGTPCTWRGGWLAAQTKRNTRPPLPRSTVISKYHTCEK